MYSIGTRVVYIGHSAVVGMPWPVDQESRQVRDAQSRQWHVQGPVLGKAELNAVLRGSPANSAAPESFCTCSR